MSELLTHTARAARNGLPTEPVDDGRLSPVERLEAL